MRHHEGAFARARLGLRAAWVGALAGLLTLGTAVAAEAAVDHEMPFACGQAWQGTSRASHSPGARAIDFNRDGDLGQSVVASAAGVVYRAADLGDTSYGRFVMIDHGGGRTSVYAHMLVLAVEEGQWVDQGQVIGAVGNTGNSYGPHLHYEQRLAGSVRRSWFDGAPYLMGLERVSANCADTPVTGDWDGDGVTDVGIFRRGVTQGRFRLRVPGQPVQVARFGNPGDQPLSGDFDGDGRDEVAVRQARTATFLIRAADGTTRSVRAGVRSAVGLTGDWDGDGVTDLGLWRADRGLFSLLMPDGTVSRVLFGSDGTVPVTGDWDDDGITDVGVYDPDEAAFRLRVMVPEPTEPTDPTQPTDPAEPTDPGTTDPAEPADPTQPTEPTTEPTPEPDPNEPPVLVPSEQVIPVGSSGDLPVTGDWNNDGVTDLGVWSPTTAAYTLWTATDPAARTTAGGTERVVRFGRSRV